MGKTRIEIMENLLEFLEIWGFIFLYQHDNAKEERGILQEWVEIGMIRQITTPLGSGYDYYEHDV